MLNLHLHSRRSRFHLGLTIIYALLVALLTVSCRQGSVVTDNTSVKTAVPMAKAAATTAPAPEATPTIQPVGPVGQTPTPRANVPKMSNIVTESTESAKMMPMPTPAPTPKPQPTPKIVMANGKIVQPWPAPPEAASLVNPFQGQAEAVKLGREYYMQKCEACHGKEGKGNGWIIGNLKKAPTN